LDKWGWLKEQNGMFGLGWVQLPQIGRFRGGRTTLMGGHEGCSVTPRTKL